MNFESADLIYQPRGIQKCNKMGGITDSTKRYGFWKKSLTNWSGVFYLQHLSEDPDWSLIQLDKMGQWISIRIVDYIEETKIHLNRYCNEIYCSNLDKIYQNTNALVDEIEHLYSDGEVEFLQIWIKTRKIPPVRLSIKDHKPIQANGHHPTRLIVSAHNFTLCLSKVASKSIESTFRRAGVNFESHTLKNSLLYYKRLKCRRRCRRRRHRRRRCVSTVNSTYVAIPAIRPFCHSFRRTAVPATFRHSTILLPFRHSAIL
jgi:hypothetical protein